MPDVKNLISLWESRSGDTKPAPSKQKKEDQLQDPLVDTMMKHSMDEKGSMAPSEKPGMVEQSTGMTQDEKTAMVEQGYAGTGEEMEGRLQSRKDHKRAFAPVFGELLHGPRNEKGMPDKKAMSMYGEKK